MKPSPRVSGLSARRLSRRQRGGHSGQRASPPASSGSPGSGGGASASPGSTDTSARRRLRRQAKRRRQGARRSKQGVLPGGGDVAMGVSGDARARVDVHDDDMLAQSARSELYMSASGCATPLLSAIGGCGGGGTSCSCVRNPCCHVLLSTGLANLSIVAPPREASAHRAASNGSASSQSAADGTRLAPAQPSPSSVIDLREVTSRAGDTTRPESGHRRERSASVPPPMAAADAEGGDGTRTAAGSGGGEPPAVTRASAAMRSNSADFDARGPARTPAGAQGARHGAGDSSPSDSPQQPAAGAVSALVSI